MQTNSIQYSRYLLGLCITLAMIQSVFQVLSYLPWDNADEEFVYVIHSRAIQIAYIVSSAAITATIAAVLILTRNIQNLYEISQENSDF